jgi:hypothetical protein
VLTVPAEPPGVMRERAKAQQAPASFEDAFEAAAAEQEGPVVENDEPQLAPAAAPARARGTGTTFVPPAVVIEREEADGTVSTVSAAARPVVKAQNPLLMHRKGLKPEPKVEMKEPAAISALRDYVLPVIFLVGGVVLSLLDGAYQNDAWQPITQNLTTVLTNMLAGVVIAVAAVFGASAMGGIAFTDSVPLVMLKLCAVALAPAAIGSLCGKFIGGFNGHMADPIIGLGCYFLFFIMVFRLTLQDQFVCVMMLWIIRVGVAYVVWRFQGYKSGSEI